jgi:pyrimidine-nucleoside phosphorylase
MAEPKVVEIIRRKRNGQVLTAAEITRLIDGHTQGEVPDCQMAAWLMAVFFRGMEMNETVALTRCMLHSGRILDLQALPGPKLDKHSTGGVGDKTSLVLAPLVAELGGIVPMISGRSLGFTGGTLNKLESIPGFNVNLSLREFQAVLEKCGCSIIGQTSELAPADRKIYSLRDATGTVESVPLICGSILSKKLAEGLDGLVLDVKVGTGAFMPTLEEAADLAHHLVDVASRLGTRTMALITDMNQPLGHAVGNSLEICEVIDTLKGEGPADLTRLCEKLALHMLRIARPNDDRGRLLQQIRQVLQSGRALDRFRRMVEAQGGDPQIIDVPLKLPQASSRSELAARKSGYVTAMDTRAIGESAMHLGVGRGTPCGTIDPAAGILIHKKIGDEVEAGEPLCTLYYNQCPDVESLLDRLLQAYKIHPQRIEAPPLIKQMIESC